MPALIDFYDRYHGYRKEFEIIAFHDDKAKSFTELDRSLRRIKKTHWDCKELPFPILLDSTGETYKAFGIKGLPSKILIDPQGKIAHVAGGTYTEKALEENLQVPMAMRVERWLDYPMQPIAVDDMKLRNLIDFLAFASGVSIRLDDIALEKSHISPADMRVLLKINGPSLPLRSWLNLALEPYGLIYTMDAGGLVVTTTSSGQVPLPRDSKREERRAARINERLDKDVTFDFTDQSLESLVEHLMEQTGVNFVIDPVARKLGTVDPSEKLTGSAEGEPLRGALVKLLKPMRMTFVVRDGVILLTAMAP